MTDRTLKRAWLHLIGAVDDREPSTSALKTIDKASIDATLGAIQDDDTWVALACLDAIQTRRDVADDQQVCKYLLQLGLRRSRVNQDVDLKDQAVMHHLRIRNQLRSQLQLVEIWETLYPNNSKEEAVRAVDGRGAADTEGKDIEGGEDDFDAWADVADTTPSPLPLSGSLIGLADFFQQDILKFIKQMARLKDAQRVATIIKSLSRLHLKMLYPYRLEVYTELIMSFASAKNDLEKLVELNLLPRMSESGETGLITECMHLCADQGDVVDRDDVQKALTGQNGEDQGQLEEGLSSSQLLQYYHDRITSLQSEMCLTLAALQLTKIVNSGKLGLQVDEGFLKISEELSLLLPLTNTREYSHWTLDHLRNEILTCHDLSQKQRLARVYLEDVDTVEEAAEATRTGAVPYLQCIAKKHNFHIEDSVASDVLSNGLQEAVLALAEKGNIRVVRLMLESGSKSGVELSQSSRQRIALSCVLAASKIDSKSEQELSKLVMSTSALLPSDGIDSQLLNQPLTGAMLLASNGAAKTPSEIFKVLSHLADAQLQYHLWSSQKNLILCHRLSKWRSDVTPALLASIQGQVKAQKDCVGRIIRAFARASKSNEQWKELIDVLIHSADVKEPFGALSRRDVARIAIEGILSAGDLRTYSSSLKAILKPFLSQEEEEEIVLNASREYYDHATSSNVHQGDMKIAYEILSVYGSTLTPRLEMEKAFIEATSRLFSFRIHSNLRSDSSIAPIEIRLSQDRLEFIKKLLESKEDAYKTPDLILEMAFKLCTVPSGSTDVKEVDQVSSKIVVESRTLALLTEAALGQIDYLQAQVSCERLVNNVQSLSKRLEQSIINKGLNQEQLSAQYQLVRESAYRTCFLLCNQHDWNDYVNRLRWASFVLAYCPEDQIDRYLKTWRQLEEQFQQDLIVNPPPSNWDQMGAHLKAGQSSGLVGSLAAIGNFGSLESLGPFGNLFASAKMPSLSGTTISTRGNPIEDPKPTATNKNETNTSPASRAARLFDSLGGGPSSTSTSDTPNMTYLDPAERAARAARRFFGGFGS